MPPPGPVVMADYIHLTTEFPSYGPGAEVVLILANPTERQYGYNLCTSLLQRLEGAQWIEVQPGLAEVCTMELRLMPPGGRATFTFRLAPGLPAGQYRARAAIEDVDAGTRLLLSSTTFAVTPRGG